MKSKFYGEINLENLDECYESEIELGGKNVEIDMWFEEETIDKEPIKKADQFLSELTKFYELSKVAIETDLKQGSIVKEYLEHHLEQIDESELSKLGIDKGSDISSKINQFYQKLELMRVGLYPTYAFDCEEFAVFDFTIGEELTNYLIVVKMSEEGKIIELTTES